MDIIERQLFEGILRSEASFEMSTVQPKRSKLPCQVWLDDRGTGRSISHNNFRLKYGPSFDDCVEVPFFEKKKSYSYVGKLSKGEPDMKSLSKWINLNYDFLVKFYEQDEDYDFIDFIGDMIPVR